MPVFGERPTRFYPRNESQLKRKPAQSGRAQKEAPMEHTVVISLPSKPTPELLARLAGKTQAEFLEYLRAEVLKLRRKEEPPCKR